jgi:electron transport complex protein RnfC
MTATRVLKTQGMDGGLRLEAHTARSTAQPIAMAAAPREAVLPLDQHAGNPARPIVRVGDCVRRGQPIAEPASDLSAWLHAPISGTVAAIEPRPAPHHGGAAAPSIVIASDGLDTAFEHEALGDRYRELAAADLCEHIARGGIVGLGGAAFPTAVKLDNNPAGLPRRLLINGAECEPYISCDHMLMRERAADVIYGARVLAHALSAPECVIALEADAVAAEQALRAALAGESQGALRIEIVPTRYPAGGERQLIAQVFGQEVPAGGLPSDIGVLCQNVGTAAAIAQWVRDGEPLIGRIVTVTGDGVHHPRNVFARLGTPFAQLIDECGGFTPRAAQLIMGGTMMGIAVPDAHLPIVKATNCIIAASPLDLQPRAAEMPCIRCGNCSEACPARLLPQQLHAFAQARDLPALERYGLMDCIECGCCDYVCPSQIPLVERFRLAKPELAAHLRMREDATAARARFESRNARLERLAAEQKARLEEKRRLARKNAPGAT